MVKTDDYTVEFHLEAPNGNFPYLTSSDNYNMIILPKGYDPAKWQSTFIGTGPFILKSYTPNSGATFTRNPTTGARRPMPAAPQFTFYASQTPGVSALVSGSIDVLGQFSVTGGEQLLSGGYNIIKLKSSAHRELSMRTDQAPFTDARVRQAIALTLNRPEIVTALFKGFADLGNDSPFAPVFPSTDTSDRPARSGHREGQVAAVRGRSPERVLHPAHRRDVQEIPTTPRSCKRARRRSTSTSTSRWRPPRSTTARRRSGTPTGWTPR